MGRIVIKIGSNVLSREDGTLDITRISSIVDQVISLRKKGTEVILVTSGAVACGRSVLRTDAHLDSVEQRQLYSAVGQVRLMNFYYEFFHDWGVSVGQVLTTKDNFTTERAYENQKACMEVMLENGVVPIVNENDTVCVTELMFTDNDELSGLVATMMKADTLVILSNVDGVFGEGTEVLRKVGADEDISRYVKPSKSSLGRGGMQSKCSVAQNIARQGTRAIIANGRRENIIMDVISDPENTVHTEFSAC